MVDHNLVHYDLATCSHRHEILATAVEADQGCPVPVTLYHWSPPTVRAKITLVMSPDVLSAIKGFSSLGTFFLPGHFDISKTLSELLEAAPTLPSQEPTPQLFTDLISQLAMPDQGSLLRFFSFPVFSNSRTEIFSDGLLPVWKWVKLDSIYRKRGFWEAGLNKAIEDGEWNGGKNLVLLVRGVSEQTRQTIVAGERKYTSFETVPS
ncbi:hypothetical protein C8A03DRAFT_45452 [Achaetomium macrosporum]|uniref:Uncharacterized protein n=1 Tax=Achaetomium macrosporum TaxID=79813 RepID=A0AAN7HAR0_9PEZI|nr:hypothetical protein C8A03DRAFT_45452 [Achaetomium macrosporum]